MNADIVMGIVIGVLVLLSAFFSAMETAFSFVNKIRIQQNVESGNKKARSALYVIDHFDKALTAILICNNVVNLGCSSIATVLCMHIFGDIGSAVATGVTTLLVLTFGEVIPKCLAKEHCDAFSVKTAGFLKALTIILSPLVFVFMKLKALALRISGRSEDAPSVTENELKYIVESIEEEGVLEESESEMVRSALDFDETTAEEVLTPRVDVVFINIDDSVDKIKDIILENRYSRIPVYENTTDNIIGILHTRDYLELLADGKIPNVRDIMIRPYFVFKSQQLSKILSTFKRTKDHIAIVTDEYGGMLGVVTLEDVLEQIVGDIWDETAEVEDEIVTLPDGAWEVDGDLPIADFAELAGVPEDSLTTDSATAGGWTIEKFGAFPRPGDTFVADGLTVKVLAMDEDGLRVERILVRREAAAGS